MARSKVQCKQRGFPIPANLQVDSCIDVTHSVACYRVVHRVNDLYVWFISLKLILKYIFFFMSSSPASFIPSIIIASLDPKLQYHFPAIISPSKSSHIVTMSNVC